MNGAQEHVGDFIASFQVTLVVDLGLSKQKTKKKNHTFGFILQQGIIYSGVHVSGHVQAYH